VLDKTSQIESISHGPRIAATDASLDVRWDILIVAIGSLIILFIAMNTLNSQMIIPSEFTDEAIESSAEMYLARDVEQALKRSEELFSRSTILLAGGVVMAFVGVGVFFFSLNDFPIGFATPYYGGFGLGYAGGFGGSAPMFGGTGQPNHSSPSTWGVPTVMIVHAFKSTAMLIFIEAISWFLLRQYRALIEDYKSFYRYYMRRANYLITFKLVAEPTELALRTRFVETLLSEELSGRLLQGQTTEGLEGQRIIDGNFAETVVNKGSEFLQRVVSK
jgi:hypothetical protein